ncbi:hypothetical protein TSUD_282240 [Trifolium subterraneum]|uniref:RNase H type-1 domain-containing protein n=1 Tax=Trifolium subterraneum TaxID=3900 RepID=A0A2Z6N133_TRISU|nr:hypothetical protein TSUD_282240 [Trifolium subterraneum]
MAANHGTPSLQVAMEEIRSFQKKVTTMENERAGQNLDFDDESFVESQPLRQSLWDSKVPDNFKSPHLPTFDGKTDPVEHLMAVGTQTAIIGAPEHLRNDHSVKSKPGNVRCSFPQWIEGGALQQVFSTEARHLNDSRNNRSKGQSLQPQRNWQSNDTHKQGYRDKPYHPPNTGGGSGYSQYRRYPADREYTPLNRAKVHVLHEILQTSLAPLPPPRMHNNIMGPDTEAWCAYHRCKDHYTERCFRLRDLIEDLIRSGHLRKFLEDAAKGQVAIPKQIPNQQKGENDNINKGEKHRVAVNTIYGGFAGGGEVNSARKRYVRRSRFEVCSVGSLTFPHTPDILFNPEDARDVIPHDDDPLVIQVQILNCDVKRVLIDLGSSADILYWNAYKAIRLSDEQLNPYSGTLVGFAGEQVDVMGHIALYTTFGEDENAKTIKVRYLVVKTLFTSYNIIIGRPTFNALGISKAEVSEKALSSALVQEAMPISSYSSSEVEAIFSEPPSGSEDRLPHKKCATQAGLSGKNGGMVNPPNEGEAHPWTLSVDGSSNLRGSGAGVVLEGPEGVLIEQSLRFAFKASNNQAEYEALIAGMKLAKETEVQELKVQSDSQLVANQVSGEFQTKDPQPTRYLEKVKEMAKQFTMFKLTYVPREQNAREDLLAKLASTKKPGNHRTVIQETLKSPSINEAEVGMVVEEEDWRSPIIRYLQRDTLPMARDEAAMMRNMAAWYTMVGDKLYKRGFSSLMLLCVSNTEACRILKEIHEGSCGSHIGSRSLAGKVMKAGFYWPNLHDDATRHVRTCDKCQRYSNLHHAPGEPLKSVLSPWPFYMWGVDILRPFPISTAQARWIIVAVDYFTKWVEAEPISGISLDQRKGNPKYLYLCRTPPSQRQTESTNKVILRALKRRISLKQESWVEHLPAILWSYHTTPQSSTGEPPFTMVYGADAIIPMEIQPSTWRRDTLTFQENNATLEEILDLLSELREKAHIRKFYIKQRAARNYNTRVIQRKFKEGDLVLKRPMGRDKGGKMTANWKGPFRVQEAFEGGAYRLETMEGQTLPRTWNIDNLRFYYS